MFWFAAEQRFSWELGSLLIFHSSARMVRLVGLEACPERSCLRARSKKLSLRTFFLLCFFLQWSDSRGQWGCRRYSATWMSPLGSCQNMKVSERFMQDPWGLYDIEGTFLPNTSKARKLNFFAVPVSYLFWAMNAGWSCAVSWSLSSRMSSVATRSVHWSCLPTGLEEAVSRFVDAL